MHVCESIQFRSLYAAFDHMQGYPALEKPGAHGPEGTTNVAKSIVRSEHLACIFQRNGTL